LDFLVPKDIKKIMKMGLGEGGVGLGRVGGGTFFFFGGGVYGGAWSLGLGAHGPSLGPVPIVLLWILT